MWGLLTSICVAPTKSIAKIASDYQKQDGLTIVPFEEITNFLYPLEVERISGIGSKTQKILKEEMNIKTVGDLANTHVQILIERFGKKIGNGCGKLQMEKTMNQYFHEKITYL
jgi:DNA polymerase IV (DinB-like DNA polymerase)